MPLTGGRKQASVMRSHHTFFISNYSLLWTMIIPLGLSVSLQHKLIATRRDMTEVAAYSKTFQRQIIWQLMMSHSNTFRCVAHTPPMISFLCGALKMRNWSIVSTTNHLWQLGRMLVITSNARSGKLGMYVAICHNATFTPWGTKQMRYRPCCFRRTLTTPQLFLFNPWTAHHVWEIIEKEKVIIFYVITSDVSSQGEVIFQFLFPFCGLKIWYFFNI